MSLAPLSSTRLLEMPPLQLDELFKRSAPGQIPRERGQGTVIVVPGTEVAKPAAKALGAIFWQGKVFDSERHDLRNLISPLGVAAIRANVYTDQSWLDGQPCIVLDYSKTSFVAGWIRDEIREVAPGLYLGLVWGVGRLFGGRRRVLKFALTFPPPTAS
jgi:hypothetical protein